MPVINHSALVQYSAEQMFALVNDIERYPEFMQGCKSARVVSSSENELIGELVLSRAGFSQWIKTRNTLIPGRQMDMHLEKGNFRHFEASWKFEPLTDTACKVSLYMNFEFAPGLLDFTLEKLFNSSANSLVDSVIKQAGKIYG